MNKNIVAIIQARMGSTRLPGKVLLPINGIATLGRIVDRITYSNKVNEIIVATTLNDKDDATEKYCMDMDIQYYRGSEKYVLGRVLTCAVSFRADIIVEISGDCPLIDSRHIDFLIDELINHDYDYVSNDVVNRSWPDGFDIQVYYTKILAKMNEIMVMEKRTNHVGWNIGLRPYTFRVKHYPAPEEYNYPDWGLTLDTVEDLVLLIEIFKHFHSHSNFSSKEIVNYLKGNPKLLEINKNIKRKNPLLDD